MKKIIQFGLAAMVVAGLSLNSCKKDDDTMDDGLEQSELSSDESNHSNELEASLNEADATISSSGLGKGPGIPGAKVGAKNGKSPGDRHAMHMSCHLMQTDIIAGQGACHGAFHNA